MSPNLTIQTQAWNDALKKVLETFDIFAPLPVNQQFDFRSLSPGLVPDISYNRGRPTTPIKIFFLPMRENVIKGKGSAKPRVILGAPSCDLWALNLLDKIYLDKDLIDTPYKANRDKTIIVGCDCYEHEENCHCTTYGLNPFPEKNADVSLAKLDDRFFLTVHSEKGEKFIGEIKKHGELKEAAAEDKKKVESKRATSKKALEKKNKGAFDQGTIKNLVLKTDDKTWEKYAEKCVSCGACSVICPTCHCFLLIERRNFEKVRSWDSCQYPGFERVAAGEDPLKKLSNRFKNRYLCKFVYKPDKFGELGCTGCGRCAAACIGHINKDDLFREVKR